MLRSLCICFTVIMGFAAVATGTIIDVGPSQSHTTIQTAIIAASDYDTVLVESGTYVENVDFLAKRITVASHYLTTSDTNYIYSTIIDPDGGRCVKIQDPLSVDIALIGFTLTGGGHGRVVAFSSKIQARKSCITELSATPLGPMVPLVAVQGSSCRALVMLILPTMSSVTTVLTTGGTATLPGAVVSAFIRNYVLSSTML